MSKHHNHSIETFDTLLTLNQKAIDFAHDNDWEAALSCISKRHDGLVRLFKKQKDFLISNHSKIIDMSEKIESTDVKIRALASTAKYDFEGKIAHLNLRKKATSAYQKIASQ